MHLFVLANIEAVPKHLNRFVCGNPVYRQLILIKLILEVERIEFLLVNHGSS